MYGELLCTQYILYHFIHIMCYIRICTAIQDYIHLHTAKHSYTQLYRAIQSYTHLDTGFTEQYTAIHGCTDLYYIYTIRCM